MAGRGDRGDRAVHRLGPAAIRIDGGRALAEPPLTVEWRIDIEWRIDVDGAQADLASACRPPHERDTHLVPVLTGPRLAVGPAELVGHRPSYRYLAWYLPGPQRRRSPPR